MPTKKKDTTRKPRKSSTKQETPKPHNVSVDINGDVKKSNIVVGDKNVVNDNSHTTVNLSNEGNAPVNIHTDEVKLDTKIHPKQFVFYGLLVVFLTGMLLVILNYVWFRFERIVTSGKFNVLVVPFVEERPWGYVNTDLGWEVAQILAEGTGDAFESSGSKTNLKIFGPADKVPQMMYLLSEKQLDREAEKISEEVNGQIVIYGVISEDEYGDKIVATKIYISPTNFGEAQELISDSMMGELSLGSIRLTGDTVNNGDLLAQNKELRDRLEIFSSIINFLGAYVGEDFVRADEYISRAENEDLWSNTNGLEVIYLIHGNMEIRRTRTDLAAKDLVGALETIERAKDFFLIANETSIENGNGSYSRAYLGLAGAESLAAIAEFNITGDRDLINTKALDRVLEYLDLAKLAEYQPESADINVKVYYSTAQVNLAYFVKTNEIVYLNNARKHYQLIVDEYLSNRNVRISEYAALSYSGLGNIEFQNGKFEEAINYFMLAQKLTINPSLKAQMLARIGDSYLSMEDYENALKFYMEALKRRSDLEKVVSDTRILQIEERIAELQELLQKEEQ